MSEQSVAGLVLVAVPLLFNIALTLLAQRFDYPDILRRPTHEVLERFRLPSMRSALSFQNGGGAWSYMLARG